MQTLQQDLYSAIFVDVSFLANLTETGSAYQIVRKHEHIHTRPLRCQLCGVAKAERKDLNRHLWVHHKDFARKNNIPSDMIACPDCGEQTRSDNLKRHRTRKHGDHSKT